MIPTTQDRPVPGLGVPHGALPDSVLGPDDVAAPPGGARPGWWRRNAPWLGLLPVAALLAAGASTFRVWAFWWPDGLHQELDRASVGETVRFSQEFLKFWPEDPQDPQTWVLREVDASVTGVREVAAFPLPDFGDPVPVPDGSTAYLVDLHLSAPLRTDLNGCQIILVAADGTRYGDDATDVLGSSNRCLPPDADDFLSTQPEWDVTSPVLTDADAEITEVWLGFGGPGYVVFERP